MPEDQDPVDDAIAQNAVGMRNLAPVKFWSRSDPMES